MFEGEAVVGGERSERSGEGLDCVEPCEALAFNLSEMGALAEF